MIFIYQRGKIKEKSEVKIPMKKYLGLLLLSTSLLATPVFAEGKAGEAVTIPGTEGKSGSKTSIPGYEKVEIPGGPVTTTETSTVTPGKSGEKTTIPGSTEPSTSQSTDQKKEEPKKEEPKKLAEEFQAVFVDWQTKTFWYSYDSMINKGVKKTEIIVMSLQKAKERNFSHNVNDIETYMFDIRDQKVTAIKNDVQKARDDAKKATSTPVDTSKITTAGRKPDDDAKVRVWFDLNSDIYWYSEEKLKETGAQNIVTVSEKIAKEQGRKHTDGEPQVYFTLMSDEEMKREKEIFGSKTEEQKVQEEVDKDKPAGESTTNGGRTSSQTQSSSSTSTSTTNEKLPDTGDSSSILLTVMGLITTFGAHKLRKKD